MRSWSFTWWLLSGLSLALVLPTAALAEIEVHWTASSGLFPDQIAAPYTLFDSASPEEPVLGPTFLTLSTSDDVEGMVYSQLGPDLSIPQQLTIETRMRFVSGASATPVRAPAQVFFAVAPTVGNILQIASDEIFLATSNTTKGPSAFVDTDDAFHTYEISVDNAGNVTVFHDGVPTLTGAVFSDANFNGNAVRVGFGQGSSLAHGTGEWEYVRHNAGVLRVPALPAFASIALAGGLIVCGRALRPRPSG